MTIRKFKDALVDLSLNFNSVDYIEHSCFMGVDFPGEMRVEKLVKKSKDKILYEVPIELFKYSMVS